MNIGKQVLYQQVMVIDSLYSYDVEYPEILSVEQHALLPTDTRVRLIGMNWFCRDA